MSIIVCYLFSFSFFFFFNDTATTEIYTLSLHDALPISGLPVLAGPAEATLIGNLLVQAIGLGELGSLAEAREVIRNSFAPAVYEPAERNAWDEAYGRFRELAPRAEALVA